MAFEGFQLSHIDVGDITLRVRHGGSGPPLLLIHGCPQTHMMWGKIVDDLARDFTIVAPDIRGYGESGKPANTPDNLAYSKRVMANDLVALMEKLGFNEFFVAGHDRGGRVAYRLALDHPQRVRKLSVLDIIPTGDVWALADARLMRVYWHWAFLALPSPQPETLINAAGPEYFLMDMLFGGLYGRGFSDPEAYADYLRCNSEPETARGVCEDYRAGATIDRQHDDEQRGKVKIACPVQVLWGGRGAVGAFYDPLKVWSVWADDLRGQSIDCGHFLPEEKPAETLAALREFFTEGL